MKQITFLWLFFLLGGYLQAQQLIRNDSTPFGAEKEMVISFVQSAENQLIIYAGKIEPFYPNYVVGHPYLDTNEFRNGILSYDGVVYPDIMLRLNLHTGQLTVSPPHRRNNVIIPSERFDYAIIDSLYIFYNKPEKDIPALSEGYVVRLHNGKYPVFKRERQFLNTSIKERVVEMSFNKRRSIYIYADGKYNQVNSKGALLKLFKSKKKELNQFIKQHRLNFKTSPESSIVAVTRYYETLTSSL